MLLDGVMSAATTRPESEPKQPVPNAANPPAAVPPSWMGALVGLGAGGSALAAGEFIAGLAAPRPGPVTAVANRVVDNAPTWFVDFGKDLFGLGDKTALIIGTVILALGFAIGLGIASLRTPRVGHAGIAGFGLVGLVSIASDAQAGIGSAIVISFFAVAAGMLTLSVLLAVADRGRLVPVSAQVPVDGAIGTPRPSRRTFMGWIGATGALAVVGGWSAQVLRSRNTATEARAAVEIVQASDAESVAGAVSRATSGPVAQTPNITPLVVPNSDFYRIDTALLVPQVDPDNWRLTIGGMVDQEVSYTYAELLERSTTVLPVTLSCVSNPVGGDLVGNAVWQGVPLTELLDEAGVQSGATQIASRSVDGWTCGFPTDVAYDGRTALVAVAMNGEPLPIEHGFPVRLVVSGLYGYVSATKWIESIELTTLEDFDGYWIPRGWSKFGPIKTQSRIDTPRRGSGVIAGENTPIAGVAWAPNTGIEAVEVQIDDGPWQAAELGESLGINAWSQWRLDWTPEPGEHRIRVRATDAGGIPQTEVQTEVAPDGASGWHTISVNAT